MSDQDYTIRVEKFKALFSQCKNVSEFRAKHPREAYFIRRMKLESRVFGPSRKSKNYWQDFGRCHEAALKCKNRGVFQRTYPGAYKSSVSNGWINQLFSKHHNKGYVHLHMKFSHLSDDQILEMVKKYDSVKALCESFKNLYWHIMRSRKDRKEYFFNHMTRLGHKHLRSVYIIKYKKQIYIGLSCDPKRRFRQHKRAKNKVAAIIKLGARLRIVKSLLSNSEAIEFESKLVKEYTTRGYEVMNIAKAGSLGAPADMIPDSELYEAAKMCNTRSEMSRKFQSFYRLAIQRNILEDLFKDHPNNGLVKVNNWSYEAILKVLTDDMNTTDLQKKYPGADAFLRRNNFLDRLIVDRPNYFKTKKAKNNTLTFDLFKKLASKMTKRELVRTHRSLSVKAYDEGWMQQVKFMQD